MTKNKDELIKELETYKNKVNILQSDLQRLVRKERKLKDKSKKPIPSWDELEKMIENKFLDENGISVKISLNRRNDYFHQYSFFGGIEILVSRETHTDIKGYFDDYAPDDDGEFRRNAPNYLRHKR